jgi:uncharacterized membrane protein
MKLSKIIKRITASSISFAALDAVWLGVVMKDFFREHLGDIARGSGNGIEPDWTAAVLVYILLVAGVNIFAVSNKSGIKRIPDSLVRGALFGFITYGIYDLTNMATLEAWTWKMSIIDMLWGAFLCATVSAIASYVE